MRPLASILYTLTRSVFLSCPDAMLSSSGRLTVGDRAPFRAAEAALFDLLLVIDTRFQLLAPISSTAATIYSIIDL